MKRLLVVAALCVGLLVGTGVAVAVGFVFFHQVRGDWAVLCWRDMVSQQKTCRLNAPPANMTLGTRRNELIVHEYAADTFQLAIEVRDPFDARFPLFLRIDQFAIHEAPIEAGIARWSGSAARGILAEMRVGRQILYRIHTAPEGMPRDTFISLEGFADSLVTYRQEIRRHGLLAATDRQ